MTHTAKYIAFLAAIIISFSASALGDSTEARLSAIKPETQHGMAFQTAVQMVSAYHMARPRMDDDFSSRAFDNYLKHLDPSRSYFLQSDIEGFEKYRYEIDDQVMKANVDLAFEIFNVYRTRLQDRIDFSLSLLRDSFDFSAIDSFEVDRENSPWCKDFQQLDQLWIRKIKYECLTIAVTDNRFSVYSSTVKKRYENLLKFSTKTKSEDVFQLFMNAVLELADPHTNYYSPRSAEDFKQSMSLSLEGIGAQLRTENEYTKVNEIIKGGPADKSKKLHAGDKIIGVGQGKDSDIVNVVDWRIDDVVALIRGKKGSLVRLQIIPASEPNKSRIIELTRDKIVLEEQASKGSVKTVTRNGKKYKIGVISIPAFYIDFKGANNGEKDYKSTTRDVKRLINEFKKENISGLIIDLRTNGGGALKEAVDLTGLFIPSGPVVQVRDQSENIRQELDNDPEVFYNGPLAVLVNRFSASASEIFSAAIQDYHRGIIIGEKTFGKGTVQDFINLNNYLTPVNGKTFGEVKLTIAKFYRVTGSSTQHKGVIPDIQLPGLYDDPKFGEEGSPFALPWDQIRTSDFTPSTQLISAESLIPNAIRRMQADQEYQWLSEDIDHLKKWDARTYQTLNMATWKSESSREDERKKAHELIRKKQTESGHENDLILSTGEEFLLDIVQQKK